MPASRGDGRPRLEWRMSPALLGNLPGWCEGDMVVTVGGCAHWGRESWKKEVKADRDGTLLEMVILC